MNLSILKTHITYIYMHLVYQRVSSSSDSEFVIKMTYAELYNEEIKDLLANTVASSSSASSSGSQSSDTPQERFLKIVDDPHLGPLIQAKKFYYLF